MGEEIEYLLVLAYCWDTQDMVSPPNTHDEE